MNGDNVVRCQCGTDLAPGLLTCPVCPRLVHSQRLGVLAREADTLESSADIRAALARLREALNLLPPASKQYQRLHQRASRLSDLIDSGQAPPTDTTLTPGDSTMEAAKNPNPLFKVGAAAGGLGLIAWKFKFILVFVATKAKLLFLGLSKATTLFSMLLSLGLYWSLWGWRFALGLVLSIYVHEMGHVAMLRRYGIKSTAPMFIPGLGAMVRMKQYPQSPREDARVGLAGPVWGLGAALLTYAVYLGSGWEAWAAIARVAAWINLFNLIPVWQLDGSRGFASLVRPHRWIAVGAIALACLCGSPFPQRLAGQCSWIIAP